MKKIVSILLMLLLVMSCIIPMTAFAKVGDVVGQAYHTDIVAYINHYAIPSYAVNGQSCIVAEDLKNFGFDVIWDNNTRSLTILRNGDIWPKEMKFNKTGAPSAKFANLLETDISVYANGKKLTSYAINGYTMIPIEELNVFGNCNWVANERAIKLWIDGLHIRSAKQSVAQAVTYSSAAKRYNSTTYGNVTGMVTWQYNKYVGTKPDTGAKVMLVQTNHVPTEQDDLNLLLFSNYGDDAIYSTKVDGSGNYYFDNIPTGEYYLLILGENTNESPSTENINISLMRSYLNGKFSEESLKSLEMSIKLHSFTIKKITIKNNQTERVSIDWGYTYI